jgi:DNA repair exonuclease SbcCD ATPase subunit
VQENAEDLTNRTTPSSDSPGGLPGPTQNVDRIREILFGPQIREYAQRFTRIEEHIAQEISEIKAEVRRRLDSLEAYTRQEGNELAERLRIERSERTESADQLSQALAENFKSMEKSLTQSNDRLSQDLRDLRQVTLDRLNSLLDDFTLQISTMGNLQNRHIEELRASTVDRFALANLLTEAAMRIRNEFGVIGLGEACDGGPKP